MNEFLGLPIVASAHGAEVDQVIVLTHWLMAILFVGWGAFFVYTLVRFRAARNPKGDYTGVTSHTSSYLEIAVAVIEAVLLIGFSIPIYAKRVNAFPPKGEALEIRVVAEQFAWNIHYPGDDGIFGTAKPELVDLQNNPLGLDKSDPHSADDVTSVNQLYLPVDKPVIVHLSSKDVIHSLGLPLMRVKQDAIPGMTVPVWFQPTKEGEYEIACSQLCGLGHYRMKGFVHVENQEKFLTWLKEQPKFGGGAEGAGGDFWN